MLDGKKRPLKSHIDAATEPDDGAHCFSKRSITLSAWFFLECPVSIDLPIGNVYLFAVLFAVAVCRNRALLKHNFCEAKCCGFCLCRRGLWGF